MANEKNLFGGGTKDMLDVDENGRGENAAPKFDFTSIFGSASNPNGAFFNC